MAPAAAPAVDTAKVAAPADTAKMGGAKKE